MAMGKYLSLHEARKEKKLERFAREHQSKGDEKKFDALLQRMARNSKAAGKT
jgi:hypothetical protein